MTTEFWVRLSFGPESHVLSGRAADDDLDVDV